MASSVPLKNEHGIGEMDKSEMKPEMDKSEMKPEMDKDGVAEISTTSPSTDGPLETVADPPSSPPSVDGPVKTVADPPSSPPSDDGPVKTVADPPSTPPSADGPVKTVADPPSTPPSVDGPVKTVADPPSSPSSVDGPVKTVADPPSSPPSVDGPVKTVADPPSTPPSADGIVKTVADPPFSQSSVDVPVETVADPPSTPPSADGPVKTVADPPSSPPSVDGPVKTVADPPSSPPSVDVPVETVADPPSTPPSADGPVKTVADPPSTPPSADGFVPTAPYPPSSPPSTDKQLETVADPPSSPPSTDEQLETVTDPPSLPPSTDKQLETVADPPSSPPSTDEPLETVADPPSSPPSTDEPLETVADPPSSPTSADGLLETVADPPSSPPSTDEPLETVADPPSSPPSADGPLETVADPPSPDGPVNAFADHASATVHELDLLNPSSRQSETTTSLPKKDKRETESSIHRNDEQEGSIVFPFNREILESLFAVCPAKDLAKFRYVSKEWSEVAVKTWREEAQVTIVNYQGKPKREYFKKLLPLDDLIQRINNSSDPLKLNFECYYFHKYKLERWYITSKNPNMVTFWGNVGPSITQLHLYDLRIENMDTILEILYEKVPNLKTLILEKLCTLRNGAYNHAERFSALPAHEKLSVLKVRKLVRFPVNWREFFGHFPAIKSLESVSITTDETLTAMLESINSIRMERDVLKLKSLTIIRADKRHRIVRLPVSEELKDLLFALKDVQLQEFNLKLGCKTTIAVASVILRTFAESLRKLTFHVDYKCRNQLHRFPYQINFPMLEELQLFQWCTPELKINHVFEYMPNLKSLKIDGTRRIFGDCEGFYEKALLPAADEKEPKLVISTGLDELSVSPTVCKSAFSLTKFEYLMNFAPNLTKLEFKMNDRIFRLACRGFPNLIEMRVGGSDLTDAGICGTATFPSVQKKRNENISDLKKLRVFILSSLTHDLTDKSVFNGFLKVPKLFTLQMSLPEEQISHEARQALEERIANLVIMRWPEGKKKGKQEEGTIESSSLSASDDNDVEKGDE